MSGLFDFFLGYFVGRSSYRRAQRKSITKAQRGQLDAQRSGLLTYTEAMRRGASGIRQALNRYETERHKVLSRVPSLPQDQQDALVPELTRRTQAQFFPNEGHPYCGCGARTASEAVIRPAHRANE
jgi:hypothetical protein